MLSYTLCWAWYTLTPSSLVASNRGHNDCCRTYLVLLDAHGGDASLFLCLLYSRIFSLPCFLLSFFYSSRVFFSLLICYIFSYSFQKKLNIYFYFFIYSYNFPNILRVDRYFIYFVIYIIHLYLL